MVFILKCGLITVNIDIVKWVEHQDLKEREFREAIHTLIVAISNSHTLKTNMVMKGAILLAIEFNGQRFTKDIDFSTDEKVSDVDIEKFLLELSEQLTLAVSKLPYGLDCRVQSHKQKPISKDATFPTLTVKIAYAYKGNKQHKRLLVGKCSTILEVDYSFNELNTEIDTIELMDGSKIKAYSLADLVAEKYRAILQQKERNRYRRQDPYDIYWLLNKGYLVGEELQGKILESLSIKAASRGIRATQHGLRDEEIIDRAKKEYSTLQDEIEGELPDFNKAYQAVKAYYEALPWQ